MTDNEFMTANNYRVAVKCCASCVYCHTSFLGPSDYGVSMSRRCLYPGVKPTFQVKATSICDKYRDGSKEG